MATKLDLWSSGRRSLLPSLVVRVLLMGIIGQAAPTGGRVVAEPASARWNVLLITADDLNCDLGCYGDPLASTPHLDRLAARGLRFEHAYCQYPVCNPSRSSFLSGRLPETTGVLDNETTPRIRLGPSALFLPQCFRAQGYLAVKLGKIYHTGPHGEDPASWDVSEDETSDAKDPPPEQILRSERHVSAKCSSIVLGVPDEEAYEGRLATRAIARLEELSGGERPFFLAVGFRRPHQPYLAPRAYFERFPQEKFFRPAEPEHLAGIPRWALTYAPGQPSTGAAEAARIRAAYYASVSFLDAQVGRLLAAVDRLGLWERTVVVFQSDHGYHLGEHGGLWHKMTLFEAATRVPWIWVAPGWPQGATCGKVVELVDLYPTLADACGVPRPDDLAGRSLVPLALGADEAWPDVAYTVVSGRVAGSKLPRWGRSVRTARWRYTEWDDGRAGRELYDYDADPSEYRNRAGDPAAATVERELQRLLDERARGRENAVPASGAR